MAKRSTKTVVGMLPVMFALSGWFFLARPWESPVDRAYRLCGECGLPSSEVGRLIGIMRKNPKTRAEKLEEFRKLFDDPLDLEYCEPCAEAVLDAARKRAQWLSRKYQGQDWPVGAGKSARLTAA